MLGAPWVLSKISPDGDREGQGCSGAVVSGRHLHRDLREPPAGCEPQGQTVPNHSPACRDASSGLPRGPWAAWSLALENQGYIGGWRGGVPAPMQTAQPVSDPYSVPLESAAFLPGTFFPLNPLLPYKRLRVGLAWHPQAPRIPKHPQGAGECPRCGGILLGVPWLSSNG